MQSSARLLAAAAVLALSGASAGAQQSPPPAKTTAPAGQTPAQNPPAAQAPKPATPAPPATTPAAPRPAAPRPKPMPAQVIVRDVSGMALSGVKMYMSGPLTLEATTDANGTASLGVMPDGVYRLRFEKDGYAIFEREVTAKAGQPSEVYVALRIAPAAAAPPPPPPAPTPPPPPPTTTIGLGPSGPPVFVSIPEFLDKNYIRREPLKESVLACLTSSTTRLLQMHENIAEHAHADVDEALYIVAGEGAIRIKGESTAVTAGSLTIVPHGVAHAIERRGKNPLMVLSMLSGAPCRVEPPAGNASNTSKK